MPQTLQRSVLILLLIGCLQPSTSAGSNIAVHRLIDHSLYQWYGGRTTAHLDPSYAGAYVMAAVGDTLYVGLSTSVPTHDHNGPLVADYHEDDLHLAGYLPEQDVNRMRVIGNKLFIPGYDPNRGGWDAGTLYILDNQTHTFTQLRYRYDSPHFVAATITDEQGTYQFTDLKPTSYRVRFIPPSGYAITQPDMGNSFQTDSNPNPSTGHDITCHGERYEVFRAILPSREDSIDAGMFVLTDEDEMVATPIEPHPTSDPDLSFFTGEMTVGDRVWQDTNRNGIQDPGEPGLSGVRVELYTRDPYFPCVIHASGLWGDAESGTIYYNGGVRTGNVTFVSEDYGATWKILAHDTRFYWARDLIYFNGYFYKTHRQIIQNRPLNFAVVAKLQYSDDLIAWQTVPLPNLSALKYVDDAGRQWAVDGMAMDETNALVVFQGRLVVLNPAGDTLYAVRDADAFDTISLTDIDLGGILPAFREPDFPPKLPNTYTGATNRYNTLANAHDELLYAITSNNLLYATPDLKQWFLVADFNAIDQGAPLIALTFWTDRNQLVAATAGETGSLYTLDHADVLASIGH